jgi:hypothetical protein
MRPFLRALRAILCHMPTKPPSPLSWLCLSTHRHVMAARDSAAARKQGHDQKCDIHAHWATHLILPSQ